MAKKKEKMPPTCFHEMYGFRLVNLLGWSRAAVKDFFLQYYQESFVSENDGCTYMKRVDGQVHILVHIEKFNKTPEMLGLLVHEITHAAMIVMKDIDQKVDNEEHEHFAYLQQWFAVNLLAGRDK